MSSVPLPSASSPAEESNLREESSVAHKAMWVVLAVLLMATILYMVGAL